MKSLRPSRALAKPADRASDFSGPVAMHRMHEPATERGVEVFAVYFDAGSRTRPHVHEMDQVLQGVEGTCVVAAETDKLLLRPGEMMLIPGGVWHWHGATPHGPACHLSIKRAGPTDWNPPAKNWATYMDGVADS
ncbi:MAG: cupin domain-containing protein [Armatimonadetes bacterium]|nr:cupin domain-containing protein [Armatimonadota bacterium]